MADKRNKLSGYDASEGALYIFLCLCWRHMDSRPACLQSTILTRRWNPRTARSLTRFFANHVLANGRQVFLTTHNPLVLDGLDLGNEAIRLFSVSRDRKGHALVSHVPVKNFPALKKKHGEFAVSRLWIEGRLGGMPDHD